MGMSMGVLSQILPLLWDHGLHREPPRLCARSQPHTGVAGSADKGRAGPGTTLLLREGRQPRARLEPERGSRTPARSDDSPLTLQQCPGNSIPGVPQQQIPFSRQ